MITEPISFTGRLSLQDVLDIHHYHSRIVIRPSIRLLMAVVSLCIAALVIVAGIHSRFMFGSFFILALCVYFPFGWLLHDRLAVRRRYRRNHDKFTDNTVTFTNESVFLTSTAADVRVTWNQLASIVTTSRGLLFLMPPNNIWFWLPQRLFEDNNYRDAILELAAEHKIPIRRMT